MKKKFRINLGSSRLAFGAMALLAVQILLSALIPQQDFEFGRIVGSEDLLQATSSTVSKLQLDRIYSSYAFQINLLLLAVFLLAGNQRRLQRFRRLRSNRMRLRTLGSLVFHFSLILIVAGVFLNSASKFDGVLGLTEGQTVSDSPAAYLKTTAGMLHGDRYDRFELKLLQLESGDDAVARLQVVEGPDGLPMRGKARINQPFGWRGLEFHLGAAVGYSPEVVLWDEQGEQIVRNFVRLHSREAGPDSMVHEDYLDHWAADRRLRIRVLPAADNGAPDFAVAVMVGPEILAAGQIAAGDTLTLAGTRIAIPRWRRWCYIFVVRNPWLSVVFAGFWLALAGQAVSAVARVASRKGGRDE